MNGFIGSVVFAAALGVGVAPGQAAPQAAAAGKQSEASKPSGVESRISQRLKADPTLKKHNIKVSVTGGVATLTGTVPTEAESAKAASLAKVNGVTRVDNQIVVDLNAGTKGTAGTATEKAKEGTQDAYGKAKSAGQKAADATKKGVSKTGEAITDAWITTKIKAGFVNEDALKDSSINVDVKDHVVTLSGTVPTAAGRTRALAIAKETEGVQNVIDKMSIAPKK